MPAPRRWWAWILGVIVFLRSTTLCIPLIDDEETFAAFARVLLHGGIPYVSVVDNKPPLVYYWYAFWLWLGGDGHTVLLHLAGMLWVAATCWVMYRIGRLIENALCGFFAALLFAIFTTTYIPGYIAIHAALLLALPTSLSVYCLLQWHSARRARWIFWSGVCAGMAVLFKYQALVQLPFTVWALIYLSVRRRETNSWRMVQGAALYFFGVMIVPLIVAWHLHQQGALAAMYDVTWLASFRYMGQGATVGQVWLRALVHIGTYVLATWLLWFVFAQQIIHRLKKYYLGLPIRRPYPTLVGGWLLWSLPAVMAGSRFYGHYFIQLLPPLCLMTGVQCARWWSPAKSVNPQRARRWLAGGLAVWSVAWMLPRLFFDPLAARFHIQNLQVEQKIATYLRVHMPLDARFFVWGTEPAIYFLAQRNPATRFLWSDSLTGRSPGLPETQRGAADTSSLVNADDWQQVMDDLARTPPLYFVDCAAGDLRDYGKFPIANYPRMALFVAAHYVLETSIDGVEMYRKRH